MALSRTAGSVNVPRSGHSGPREGSHSRIGKSPRVVAMLGVRVTGPWDAQVVGGTVFLGVPVRLLLEEASLGTDEPSQAGGSR